MTEPVAASPAASVARSSTRAAPARLLRATLQSPAVRRAGELLLAASWRVRHLGPRRGSALAAVLVSVFVAAFVVWPMQEKAKLLQQQLAQLPDAPPARAIADRDSTPALPRVQALPAIVGGLQSRAQAAGLELETGTYRLVAGKNGGPSRYEISLPLTGSYPGIRQFVETSLAAVPTLALDGLSLQRPDVGSAKVAVEVHFVVFVSEGA